MSKKIVLLLGLALSITTVFAAPPSSLQPVDGKDAKEAPKNSSSVQLDRNTVYYPNATVKSAIAKYKADNYTGCLQELFSVVKKEPSNALAYYYMAMAFTHLDMQADAVDAYNKVINLNSNDYLYDYALKGRDCLTGGPACLGDTATAGEQDELDKFINAPYDENLVSPEMMKELKQLELNKIQKTINKKDKLENNDIQEIKEFDLKNNNQSMEEETILIAQVSDEEVLQAINTLKEAGLNLNVQSESNPYSMPYQNPQMAEMSMLLGNGNNNNNNSAMNMIPMLMDKANKGENIDPRFIQSMMMNSMMADFNFNTNDNNRY